MITEEEESSQLKSGPSPIDRRSHHLEAHTRTAPSPKMSVIRLTCGLPSCILGQGAETDGKYKTAPHWKTNTEVQIDMNMHLEVHKMLFASRDPTTRLNCSPPHPHFGPGTRSRPPIRDPPSPNDDRRGTAEYDSSHRNPQDTNRPRIAYSTRGIAHTHT